MRQATHVCFITLFVSLFAFSAPSFLAAQLSMPVHHVKHPVSKPKPKPEPTQQELIEYLRGKLLSFSPSDGINDNSEVAYDLATTALTITRPDGRCVNYLNALDTNSLVWEIFDPSDTHDSREKLLRLSITSTSGKTARNCFDRKNHPDTSAPSNRVRLLFSASQAKQSPDFQNNMTKAIKKLIVLSGGVPEKKLF
jgi:hypothetical protein